MSYPRQKERNSTVLMSIPLHLRADYLARLVHGMPRRYTITQLGDPQRQAWLKRVLPAVYTQHVLQARADAILSDYDCPGVL
jgi:hypothetical protein